MNTVELSEKYNVNRHRIANAAKSGHLKAEKNGRIWNINEQVFLEWYETEYKGSPYNSGIKWNREVFDNIDNPEKAYWVGFILADGCLHEGTSTLSVDLSIRDKIHLEKFITFIGGDVDQLLQTTIHSITHKKLVHVQLCGKHTYNSLLQLGLFPQKSGHEKYIYTNYDKDFIRGIVDGDGYIRQDLTEIGIVGSYELLATIQEKFFHYLKVKPNKIMVHGTIFRISYRSKQAVYSIIEWLYENAEVSLERKQTLANYILNEKIC